jgi:allantoate deiminase
MLSRVSTQADRMGARMARRLRELAAVTDEPGAITRLYLSDAHRRAIPLVAGWMREAGMAVTVDPLATVVGRVEGRTPGAPALRIGSHIDTVRHAGAFDGTMGVVAAIEAVEALRQSGFEPPFAIEVLAFGDEEGVRFPTTLSGSRAAAGQFDPHVLDECDADGVSRRAALATAGGEPGADPLAYWRARPAVAYLEAHIEQGPVLENQDLALGVVTAIAGARRGDCRILGQAGHAGTVPMALRRDALVAAAEMILAVSAIASRHPGSVATVGVVEAMGGAVNTVPGDVHFSLDVRSGDDHQCDAVWSAIDVEIGRIAAERSVRARLDCTHAALAAACDSSLCDLISQAMRDTGHEPLQLVSGAGHDAMAFRGVLPFAMLFVRCRAGLSHHPDEHAEAADMGAAAEVLVRAIRAMAARG